MLLALLVACTSREAAPPRFLRGALLLDAPVDGARAVGGGRWLLEADWPAGGELEVAGRSLAAPLRPECVRIARADLGDASRHVALGGGVPDTALAFSPDGDRLAVGTFLGEVLVLDAWTGEVLARRRLAEAMVKRVAWSPDGATLYAGEQSPDANLSALDPETLEPRWTLALADVVGSSTPPAGADVWGVYSLPGVYGIEVLDGGRRLLVAATHGWAEEGPAGARRRNRARLLLVDAENGRIVGGWPEAPVEATLTHPRVRGGLVAVPVGHSSALPPPPELPVDGVAVLRLPDLAPVDALRIPPLAPLYDRVFLWEGVDVDGQRVVAGTGDGRVVLHPLGGGAPDTVLELGTPIDAEGVPVAASVGFAVLRDGVVYAATSGSSIPYGAATPDLRPPSPHPGENTVWAHDAATGRPLWAWAAEQRVAGLAAARWGDALLVGAGERAADRRSDLYGVAVLDLSGPPDRPGSDRLEAFCPTEGPVFFRFDSTPDGRIAAAVGPVATGDGGVAGAYEVVVLR